MRKATVAAALLTLGLAGGVAVFGQRPVAPPSAGATPPPAPVAQDPFSPPAQANGDADDPMHDVEAFIDEGRKKAGDSIEKLTKEAERLRARLEKVESALERWKAVAAGLEKQPEDLARPAAEQPPTDLTPAPIERRAPVPSILELPPTAPELPSLPSEPR